MKVAVVGATGLVGTKMLQVLAERNFPVDELIPVASEKSVGKEVEFKGAKYKVVSMTEAIAASSKAELPLFRLKRASSSLPSRPIVEMTTVFFPASGRGDEGFHLSMTF